MKRNYEISKANFKAVRIATYCFELNTALEFVKDWLNTNKTNATTTLEMVCRDSDGYVAIIRWQVL